MISVENCMISHPHVFYTPLKAADGSLQSDRESVVSRWKEHFCNLLNCPLHDPPDVLVAEAEAAIPDAHTDTHPPTVLETYRAARRIKAGKAPGACGIYPEYIRYGGHGFVGTKRALRPGVVTGSCPR